VDESPSCDDGVDNDGDGAVDHPADPGCFRRYSVFEAPECDDGLDNDGDGRIDWDGGGAGGQADPQCTTPYRTAEKSGCGLGFEVALLAPLALRARRLRRALAARGGPISG
jgi:hypothetical protein